MQVFFDASAFAKRYVGERGTALVLEWCDRADELVLSVVALPGMISAFCRLRREARLTPAEYTQIKQDLMANLADAVRHDARRVEVHHSGAESQRAAWNGCHSHRRRAVVRGRCVRLCRCTSMCRCPGRRLESGCPVGEPGRRQAMASSLLVHAADHLAVINEEPGAQRLPAPTLPALPSDAPDS